MKSLRQKVIILFGTAALLLGSFCFAEAQFRSRVRVYHPRRYNNTRTLMSRRAAMRKVVKQRRQAARKRRQALHQTHR
jgi:hypothetical protein